MENTMLRSPMVQSLPIFTGVIYQWSYSIFCQHLCAEAISILNKSASKRCERPCHHVAQELLLNWIHGLPLMRSAYSYYGNIMLVNVNNITTIYLHVCIYATYNILYFYYLIVALFECDGNWICNDKPSRVLWHQWLTRNIYIYTYIYNV